MWVISYRGPMPKLSKFQKLLRIEAKLCKHMFRHMSLKSTYTVIAGYDAVKKAERIKKSVIRIRAGRELGFVKYERV